MPSDFPAALGSLDETDLPIVSGDLTSGKTAVGAAAGAFAKPSTLAGAPSTTGVRPPAPVARDAFDDDFGLDLPETAAGLPIVFGHPEGTKPSRPSPPRVAPAADGETGPHADLPAVASDLPVAAAGLPVATRGRASLPVAAAGLPVPVAPVPGGSAGLPAVVASSPTARASLPVRSTLHPDVTGDAPARRSVPAARAFGEIDLPAVAESLPVASSRAASSRPPDADVEGMHGGFGEIDLPHEVPPSWRPPTAGSPQAVPEPARVADAPHFADLELDDAPLRRRSGTLGAVAANASSTGAGGMSFGEVDLGGGGATVRDDADPLALEEPRTSTSAESSFDAASPALTATSWHPPVAAPPAVAPVSRERAASRRRVRPTYARLLIAAAWMLLVAAGAALQLTPYGAFGYLALTDLVRAGQYARATSSAVAETEAALSPDTYDAAKNAAALAQAAHARTPRARPLTAYAALVDGVVAVRFGPDTSRVSHAKQLLNELPADKIVRYRDAAVAAQSAEMGEIDKARKGLEAAGRREPEDPVQTEVALLQGEVELAAGDASAARVAFQNAAARTGDARAHFGLARAYDALGDAPNAAKEIQATLAVSPQHPGSLILRARSQSMTAEPLHALADIAIVLEGTARPRASPSELSSAYAARAWVQLERGQASEARASFDEAVKINPVNVDALNGEGRLLLDEGRYAEALARFDTALGFAPDSPATIANDADAKLALERLADAKQQLVAGHERFPKSISILLLLGKVEQHLGDLDGAEANLRMATAQVDPSRRDAVAPFVALCELQSARGRLSDARATLDDAKKKLPPSSALDRAFGSFDELQGNYEGAVVHDRDAIERDPKDLAAHFRLAVVLRRTHRFADAGVELDRVEAVDHDYPGLVLERGLLFEDAGDVQKAIDQFKTALAKAPEDPDLQLRVGSAYVAIGRPDDALPMLHKVLDKRAGSAEANHYIGRALMLKGGTPAVDAIRYLKRAVELDPNRAEFHVYLAWAADDATPPQLELARDEIDRALALDKLNAEAYWQRAVLERMEGAVDDAVKDAKRALELRPTRYEAHATLAECLEDKNDNAAALAEWPRALAGDANATVADGATAHPYWHYRYGKLLIEKGSAGAALAHLLPAALTAEKLDSRPAWLAPLEFLTAEALRHAGRKGDALEHYRRFLDTAPVNSPDRYDAERAVAQLSGSR